MHFLDIIFLCAAAIVTAIGIWRGLIVEAFRFLAVVTGFVAASTLYRHVFPLFGFLSDSSSVKFVVAFVVVFVIAVLAVLGIGWAVKKVVHLTILGWVDRLAGGALGFAKCAIVAWVVVVVIAALPVSGFQKTLEKRSIVYRTCARIPLRLRMPGVREARETLEDMISNESISTIPDRIEDLKSKVDSVRDSMD